MEKYREFVRRALEDNKSVMAQEDVQEFEKRMESAENEKQLDRIYDEIVHYRMLQQDNKPDWF